MPLPDRVLNTINHSNLGQEPNLEPVVFSHSFKNIKKSTKKSKKDKNCKEKSVGEMPTHGQLSQVKKSSLLPSQKLPISKNRVGSPSGENLSSVKLQGTKTSLGSTDRNESITGRRSNKLGNLNLKDALQGNNINPCKLRTLRKSFNSWERGYSPFHRRRGILKEFSFDSLPLKLKNRIARTLSGNLIFTKIPVGLPLSSTIHYVCNPSFKLCKFLLTKLPYWVTSYTLLDVKYIGQTLKKGARA